MSINLSKVFSNSKMRTALAGSVPVLIIATALLVSIFASPFPTAADKLPQKTAAAATATPSKPLGIVDPLAKQKRLDAYKKLVTDLSSPEMEGRGPGTKGLDKARDYLVNELKTLDLKPAFAAPSSNTKKSTQSYTQAFEINAGVKVVKQSFSILDAGKKQVMQAAAGDTFSPRGYSGSASFQGEAVFVGYGITNPQQKHDDYAGMGKDALKNKIAVAYRYEPMTKDNKTKWVKDARFGQWGKHASLIDKAKSAAAHGAVALVIIDPPSLQKAGSLPSTAGTQAGSTAPIPVIQIKPEVFRAMLRQHGQGEQSFAKRLQQQANDGPATPLTLKNVNIKGDVKLIKAKATVHNVAGYLPGWGKLKDQIIVIGAHYDHLGFGGMGSLARTKSSKDKAKLIHHGADDNGSGTAALVLLARDIVGFDRAPSGPARSKDSLGRRTVLFTFFTAEERGLLGSAHMLRYPEKFSINGKSGKENGIKLTDFTAMLNMDMIGRMRENKLMAVGTATGDKFKAMIESAAKGMDLKVNVEARAAGGSDQMSFHMKQIPAIHFFTGAHKDYHKPTDTAEKINYVGAVKTTNLLATMVLNYWQNEIKINYIKARMAHPTKGGPRGFGAYLGVIPNYASLDAETGCAIDGVSDNSPAEDAGLKGNDVIIAWDKTKIKNLHDLTDALRSSKPGQKVKLTIKRDGKNMILTAKIGTRG